MADHEKKPAQGGQSVISSGSVQPSHTRITQGTKRHSVLATLLRKQRGLTCFEAVRECNDYVLRSTVSDLQREYGIRIDRAETKVFNSYGGVTRCARYWISEDQRPKALELLGEGGTHAAH